MTSRYTLSMERGFLGVETAAVCADIRKRFAPWFDLAEDVNRLAMRILYEVRPARDNPQRFVEATLFGRALQSFQATIVLAERGMTADARAVLRSACESVIIQMKIGADPTFLDALAARHVHHRKALGNSWLKDSRSRAEMGPEEAAAVRVAIDEISREHPKAGDINLADVAKSLDAAVLYNAIYRPASGDGAHATLDSLMRHYVINAKDEIVGLKFAPDDHDLAQTLIDAMNILFHGMGAAINRFSLAQFQQDIADCVSRWKPLVERVRTNTDRT